MDNVKDDEFESDFEELYETDEDIDDLYNATDIVKKRMVKDEFFHMDNKKWGDMINEAMNHGFLKDTRKCEAILEDMLSWDKLLPGISLYACDIGRVFVSSAFLPSSLFLHGYLGSINQFVVLGFF